MIPRRLPAHHGIYPPYGTGGSPVRVLSDDGSFDGNTHDGP
jgi:hypothetical protein